MLVVDDVEAGLVGTGSFLHSVFVCGLVKSPAGSTYVSSKSLRSGWKPLLDVGGEV